MLLVINMKTGGFHLTTVRMAKRNLGNIIWDKRVDSLLFQSKDLMMLIKRLLLGFMEELWPSASFLRMNGLTGKGKGFFLSPWSLLRRCSSHFSVTLPKDQLMQTSNSLVRSLFEGHCLLPYTMQFIRQHIHTTALG